MPQIQGPITFDKLPDEVQKEVISHLINGNSKVDLARMYLACMIHEQMCLLLDELKDTQAVYKHEIGDDLYPETAKLDFQR